MNAEQFWSVIDAAAAVYDDLDDRIRAISAHLEHESDAGLATFRDLLLTQLAAGCSNDLFTAGVLLTGRTFAEQETFTAFCCALLLRGRAVYAAVLADPDQLGQYPLTQEEKELDFAADMLLYAPAFAYQNRHGEEADLDADYPPSGDLNRSWEPQVLADPEALRARFPLLWPLRRAMIPPKEMMA